MMKSWIFKLALIASLNFVVEGAFAQGYTYQWLAPSDAIQKVQQFEGNPSLAVTITQMPSPNVPSLEGKYTLTAGRYEYEVFQAYRNGLFRSDETWINDKVNFYGQQPEPNAPGQQIMSPDTAQAVAWNFVQSHYPHPEVLTYKDVAPESGTGDGATNPRYYECYFYQVDSNGVRGPGRCHIEVDSVLSQIILYYAEFFPLLVSTAPALTVDQAAAAAMNGMNVSNGTLIANNVSLCWVDRPDTMGVERVGYEVRFTGIGPADPNGMAAYDVMVDANTGETIKWNTVAAFIQKPTLPSPTFIALRHRMAKERASSPPVLEFAQDGHKMKLAFPPRLVNGHPYMYAGYLCYGSDARLSMTKTGEVNITGRGRQLTFKVGAKTYTLNGNVRQFSAPPVTIDKQCYVPLEAFDAVLPNALHYSLFTKQVSLDLHSTRHKTSDMEGATAVGAGAVSLYGLSKIKRRVTAGHGQP